MSDYKKYVVHCKKSKYDIYIGRPSKWGNMYSHLTHLPSSIIIVGSREEAVAKYKEWIMTQPELIAAAKKELKGKILSCHCSPLLCHGEVLAEIANSEEME